MFCARISAPAPPPEGLCADWGRRQSQLLNKHIRKEAKRKKQRGGKKPGLDWTQASQPRELLFFWTHKRDGNVAKILRRSLRLPAPRKHKIVTVVLVDNYQFYDFNAYAEAKFDVSPNKFFDALIDTDDSPLLSFIADFTDTPETLKPYRHGFGADINSHAPNARDDNRVGELPADADDDSPDAADDAAAGSRHGAQPDPADDANYDSDGFAYAF